ncbi:MAG: hypothetical protein HPY68_09035 [Candidatus Atribacteria bacterium]|nr:hypothetical protein [Candidatus Atribacteria bacterium]
MSLVSDIVILLLPSLLTYVFTRLGLDKLKLQKYERLLRLAEEAVLFAEDAFPDSPGMEKLRKAVEYLKMVAAKAGLRLSDKEAEEKARVAFQRVQKGALENLVKRVLEHPGP